MNAVKQEIISEELRQSKKAQYIYPHIPQKKFGKLLRKKAWNQFRIKSYAEHDNIQKDNAGSTEIKEKEAFLTERFSSKGKPYNPDGEVTKRE